MANTEPDGIIYPGGGDQLNPLRTWFAQLASTTQAAITALRNEAVLPDLPDPISVKGASVQAVSATSWADLPNMEPVVLNLDAPCWVTIDIGAWVIATAGDTRISARVTGATTLGESQVEVGGDTASWGQVIYAGAASGTRQQTAHRTVRLNAGENTIQARAYRTGSGTHNSNYTTLQVAPTRWA